MSDWFEGIHCDIYHVKTEIQHTERRIYMFEFAGRYIIKETVRFEKDTSEATAIYSVLRNQLGDIE